MIERVLSVSFVESNGWAFLCLFGDGSVSYVLETHDLYPEACLRAGTMLWEEAEVILDSRVVEND
jgi:hypothetical protein